MNDCKTIHEAYWEAVRVERMLKQSYLVKVMPQDGQLPQIIADRHVDEEPVQMISRLTLQCQNQRMSRKIKKRPKFPHA